MLLPIEIHSKHCRSGENHPKQPFLFNDISGKILLKFAIQQFHSLIWNPVFFDRPHSGYWL